MIKRIMGGNSRKNNRRRPTNYTILIEGIKLLQVNKNHKNYCSIMYLPPKFHGTQY